MPFEELVLLLVLIILGMVCIFLYLSYINLKEKLNKSQHPVIGTILIETSDPDGPFLFLDLDMPVEQIGTFTEVVCKVDTNGVVGKGSE